MKSIIGILSVLILFVSETYAQLQFTGYSLDNFSGYHSTFLNPALIADSRVKFEIGTSFNNSKSNNFTAGSLSIGSERYFRQQKRWYLYDNNDVNIIGAMLNLDHKNAFSYTWRIRTFGNAHGVSDNFTRIMFEGYMPDYTMSTSVQNMSFQRQRYNDHSFTYARVILDEKRRHLKAGATFKILTGLESSYFYSSDANLDFDPAGTGYLNNTEFGYGYADNNALPTNKKTTVGADIGVVYEFRPERNFYKYEMNGNKNKIRHDLNKYKYKLGFSVLNIGRIKYTKDTSTYDFVSNNAMVSAQNMFPTVNSGEDVPYINFQPSYISNVTKSDNNKETYTMALPLEISLQADYNIKDNYYVAFVSNIPIWFPSDANKSHDIFIATITPRWEGRMNLPVNNYYQYIPKRKVHVGFALPISFQKNGQMNVGFMARTTIHSLTGFIGANNITPILGQKRIFNTNFFIGVKFSMKHRKEDDFDEDNVSDDKDLCFYEKGDWRMFGCPDSDGDGIPDNKDYCPNNAGPKSTNGCPDTDKDGVLDFVDHCPNQKGIPALNGCPDSDKDGIIDDIDRCPLVTGPYQNNGCPYPPVETGCCKDTDGDGVLDKVDKCPKIGGEVTNQGCPVGQKVNTEDLQPNDSTTNNNNQGEELKEVEGLNEEIKSPFDYNNAYFEEEKQKHNDSIDYYLYNKNKRNTIVYFGNDSHRIEDKYKKELGDMVKSNNKILPITKYSKIQIIGHTDNVGDEVYNLLLSKKRVEAVRSYLINLGVPDSAIEMYYKGEYAPVTGNQNEVEKALNRRVEVFMVRF